MHIEIIRCLQDNYSYLIVDNTNNTACVIDPGEAKPIIDYIEKKEINLKFILNTHHHGDHVNGNLEIKKKFNSKVIGYKGDKERIPGIDFLVDDNQIWEEDRFKAKIYHIPGHTSGHIAFHFFNQKKIFTGDTLFSLGCGRIFEGTYKQMYSSLERIKSLPKNTLIYCAHEYTKSNLLWALNLKPKDQDIKNKLSEVEKKLSLNELTIPFSLDEELKINLFLRAKNLKEFTFLRANKDFWV